MKKAIKVLGRWLWRVFATIVVIIIALPIIVYIPAVQNFAKDIAVKEVKKSTGMDVSIDYLRIRFPLRVELDSVCVIEKEAPDTMLQVGLAKVDVAVLPLLKGDIRAEGIAVDDVKYKLGTPDSITYLVADVARARINSGGMQLKDGIIDIDEASVESARIRLVLKPDSMPSPPDTAQTKPLIIRAKRIDLDDITYTMQMLPSIDSLYAHVGHASLDYGNIDMAAQDIKARYLSVDSVDAAYFVPSPAFLKQHPELFVETPPDTLSIDKGPWTVKADSLSLTARSGLYATSGVKPRSGLDMEYLKVTDVTIKVDSFYNRGTEICVPLRQITATERCGISLDGHGTFAMDSTRMWVNDILLLTTAGSQIYIEEASMPMDDFIANPRLPVNLNGSLRIAPRDVLSALPSLRSTLGPLSTRGNITASADIRGSVAKMQINRLNVNAFNILKLKAAGTVANIMDFDRLAGNVTLDGSISNPTPFLSLLPSGLLPKGAKIPPVTLAGNIDYRPGNISGDIKGTAASGAVAVSGSWVQKSQGYDADIKLDKFPVDAFVPEYGIGRVTATLRAKGHGYNPLALSTSMDVDLDVTSIEYQKENINDIRLTAHTGGGKAEGKFNSTWRRLDMDADFTASMARDDYAWDLAADVRNVDLNGFPLLNMPLEGHMYIESTGHYNPLNGDIDAEAYVDDVNMRYDSIEIDSPEITAALTTTRASVDAKIATGDFNLNLASRSSLDALIASFEKLPALADTIIKNRNLDVDRLQQALPYMEMQLAMKDNNIVSRYLQDSGISFSDLSLNLRNDSLITLDGNVTNFITGGTLLDTISVSAYQRGKNLVYDAAVNNRRGTMDEFAHMRLNGFIANNRLSAFFNQSNISGETGYSLGLLASLADSTVTARLVPTSPTIAYRKWTLNPDNYLSYNLYNGYIKGDVSLSNGNSLIRVYTSPGDTPDGPEDLLAQLRDVHLSDWLAMTPFAPPISGNLSADVRVKYIDRQLTGNGSIALADFKYDNNRVGNLNADIGVNIEPNTGLLRAEADLLVDSVKTMTISGVLNDSTAVNPMLLDFTVIHFPLKVANAFIPDGMATLSGTLNGKMKITGKGADPVFDGYLNFDDDASVNVAMLGTPLKLSSEKIPVDNNIVTFDQFAITAANENPLYINGTTDLSNLSNIAVDLNLFASDIQVVNSTRPHGASVYGKGYLNINADVKGNMRFMRTNASVELLEGSNVTYVLPTASSSLSLPGTSDMVKFVQFNDTTLTADADSLENIGMMFLLNAEIKVDDGTTINVDLSPDGKNKVQLHGYGHLTYASSPLNEGRMTGRYTIESGFVRYTPPVLSEKLFKFKEGSYVAFTGNMLNPTLSIYATDEIKANVSRTGENSRLVNFDVEVAVTNTLENMSVAFDLSTNDDITVSNELASMSPDQRASQAMNLLLYGVYSINGTTGDANIGGNLLYSFVESTLNNWMAKNIKGVDITFDINQYDKTYDGATSTATNYSYHVSKSLFNDRFKIIVGGTYSTDNEGSDENVAESLFNDISAEYLLNKAGTMYVRIFRHTGFESILEGEVTQTGVGFVYRRRIHSLLDMFRFISPGKKSTTPTPLVLKPNNANE